MYVLIKEPTRLEPIKYNSDYIELKEKYVIVDGKEYEYDIIQGQDKNTIDIIVSHAELYWYKNFELSKIEIKEKIEKRFSYIVNGLTECEYTSETIVIKSWENNKGKIVLKSENINFFIVRDLFWPSFITDNLFNIIGGRRIRYKYLEDLFRVYFNLSEKIQISWLPFNIEKHKPNENSYSVTKPTKTMAEIKSNMDIVIAKRKLENDKDDPKQSAFNEMFADLTSGMVRYVDLNKFPSMLFWFRDGKCLIGLNFLTKEIFFDLDAIWRPFTYNLGCATNDTKYNLEKISKKYFINSPELSAVTVLKVYDIKDIENYFNSTSKVD